MKVISFFILGKFLEQSRKFLGTFSANPPPLHLRLGGTYFGFFLILSSQRLPASCSWAVAVAVRTVSFNWDIVP